MTRKCIFLIGLFIVLICSGLFLFKKETLEIGTDLHENQNVDSSLKGRQDPPKAPDLRGDELLVGWLLFQSTGDRNPSDGGFSSQELIDILHEDRKGTRDFYIRAQQILMDPSIDVSTKHELIHILKRAATPDAVRLIAELIQTGAPDELKQDLYNSLAMIGEYFWDRRDLPEVSNLIITLLQEVQDQDFLNALTTAMANIGNETDLNFLFDVVSSREGTLEDLRNSNDPLLKAALSALERIPSPDSASTIASRLIDSTNSAEMAICAGMLAAINDPIGTKYLLSWAQNADDSSSSLVSEIFRRISPSGMEYISTIKMSNLYFRSPQVENAVLSALGVQP